jgi:hypothetical protein
MMKLQGKKEGLELSEAYFLIIYWMKTNTIKKNRETVFIKK